MGHDQLASLAEPRIWGAPVVYRSASVLGSGVSVARVLYHIAGVPQARTLDPVMKAAAEASRALARLPPELDLMEAGDDAIERVRRLVQALETSQPSSDSAEPLVSLIRGASLNSALARQIADRVRKVLRERVSTLASFSLILFRDFDHDGAVLESFRTDRAAWFSALAGPRDSPDPHLAIIAPAACHEAIEDLANQLGARDALPFVVFLGETPDVDEVIGEFATRLTIRRLRPGGYPAQLGRYYRSVYHPKAVAAGKRRAAAFDAILARYNPWTWLGVVAGGIFGRQGAEVVDQVRKLGVEAKAGG